MSADTRKNEGKMKDFYSHVTTQLDITYAWPELISRHWLIIEYDPNSCGTLQTKNCIFSTANISKHLFISLPSVLLFVFMMTMYRASDM